MANNWIIHYTIITCLLIVVVQMGGCSPPIPKTLLPPPDGTMSIDRMHAMASLKVTAL